MDLETDPETEHLIAQLLAEEMGLVNDLAMAESLQVAQAIADSHSSPG
jgi:hypothetical protein